MKPIGIKVLLTGIILGSLLSIINLYVVLKTGWSVGTQFASCFVSYILFRVAGKNLSLLENYSVQSLTSASGAVAFASIGSAIPALYFGTGKEISWWILFPYILSISLSGLFLAWPLRKIFLINTDYSFPSSRALVETLKSMHEYSSGHTSRIWRFIFSGLISGIVAFFRDIPGSLYSGFKISTVYGTLLKYKGYTFEDLSLGFENSLLMIGTGVFIGIRTTASMLLGTVVIHLFISPELMYRNIINGSGYFVLSQWYVWAGISLISSYLLFKSFFHLKQILKYFKNIYLYFKKTILIVSVVIIVLLNIFFGIDIWLLICSLILSYISVIISLRISAESDVISSGLMGNIGQLEYGILNPGNLTGNIMTSSLISAVTIHSNDLMFTLKTGKLLGADLKKQFMIQILGVFAGTVSVVPFYLYLFSRSLIGTCTLPAPGVQMYLYTSKLYSNGIAVLEPAVLYSILIAVALAALIILLECFFNAYYRKYIPSPIGLGLSVIIPGSFVITMFTGALLSEIWSKLSHESGIKTKQNSNYPIAAGFIAGESLVAVIVSVLMFLILF